MDELKRIERSDTEQARWLADKIPAYGDYAAEAGQLLIKLADALDARQSAGQERGEAVAWQRFHNGEWRSCTKSFHDNCLNLADYGSSECVYQVRALYTTPDAGRVAELTEVAAWHRRMNVELGGKGDEWAASEMYRCPHGAFATALESLSKKLATAVNDAGTLGQCFVEHKSRIATLESQLAESREREARMREAASRAAQLLEAFLDDDALQVLEEALAAEKE